MAEVNSEKVIGGSRLTWVKESWCDEAEKALIDLLDGGKELFKKELELGECDLWRITCEQGKTSWLMMRLETDVLGDSELVLIAGRGSGMAQVIEQLKKGCKEQGIKSIRAHSSRLGYEKFVSPMGFKKIESVYRCEI